MALRKFNRVEDTEVLSPSEHEVVQDELNKLGKTSATQLSDAERQSLQIRLDSEK